MATKLGLWTVPGSGVNITALRAGDNVLAQGTFGGGTGTIELYSRLSMDAPWVKVGAYTEDFLMGFLPAPYWKAVVVSITGGEAEVWVRASDD